jgi:hypothetical protein
MNEFHITETIVMAAAISKMIRGRVTVRLNYPLVPARGANQD